MSFENHDAEAAIDVPCRYGASKLMCRGPKKNLKKPYVAFIGSTETYGKFVKHPFPDMVERALGMPCVNLGGVNTGIDSYVNDTDIMRVASNADVSVVQVMGAQNLSNRFYRVHPRRNDRFLKASQLLATIYRDVDFTEFTFNKHMLGTLKRMSPERFHTVEDELRTAWMNRMRLVMRGVSRRSVLLWLRYDTSVEGGVAEELGPKPPMVTPDMVAAIGELADSTIEVRVRPARESGDLADMQFAALQTPTAELMIGPGMHKTIADALIPALNALI